MNPPSTTHLVIIPSYNTGVRILNTVREALVHWQPVWVVVDGSTDGSDTAVEALVATEPGLKVMRLPSNRGKGAALLAAAEEARAAGFSHFLAMDADGQHPADRIAEFMDASRQKPDALILGRPVFGPEAPAIRLQGRKLSVGLVRFEVAGDGVDDPLFGFRVYPIEPLLRVFASTRWARRYDFDPEMAVRLVWDGVPTVNLPAGCRYIAKEDGGVSHFHYVRDNVRMVWLHTRLITEFMAWRWYRKGRWRTNPRVVTMLLAILLAANAAVTRAAEPAPERGALLTEGAAAENWKPLLAALGSKGSVWSKFTEHRWFPFKKIPVVLEGEMRMSPQRGLSLHYTVPEERSVIMDAQGLVLRDARGRTREVPAEAGTGAASGALLPILRFDMAELLRQFLVYGVRTGETWRIDFVPKDEALAKMLGSIVVRGEGERIKELEFRRSAMQRVEILIGETHAGVPFSEEELKRYFR